MTSDAKRYYLEQNKRRKHSMLEREAWVERRKSFTPAELEMWGDWHKPLKPLSPPVSGRHYRWSNEIGDFVVIDGTNSILGRN